MLSLIVALLAVAACIITAGVLHQRRRSRRTRSERLHEALTVWGGQSGFVTPMVRLTLLQNLLAAITQTGTMPAGYSQGGLLLDLNPLLEECSAELWQQASRPGGEEALFALFDLIVSTAPSTQQYYGLQPTTLQWPTEYERVLCLMVDVPTVEQFPSLIGSDLLRTMTAEQARVMHVDAIGYNNWVLGIKLLALTEHHKRTWVEWPRTVDHFHLIQMIMRLRAAARDAWLQS